MRRELDEERIAESLIGETIRTGEMVYVDDLEHSEHFDQEVVAARNASVRDVLVMPFRSLDGRNITGAVQLVNRIDGKPYTDEDRALLSEMLQRLETSMESIYFRQEAGGVVGRVYKLLRWSTVGVSLAFFGFLIAFTLYWFSFFFIGSE